ncbi:MAG: acetyl-CoA carboxylase biotin carboxyl carrier protein [Magnetococcales bacterium]|nr:acetyl-CoA carboxylase biotin carboxyl carrier protein [Magnetococcales bacterium]
MELKEIRQLIKMLEGTDVTEIEVRQNDQVVRVNRSPEMVRRERMSSPLASPFSASPVEFVPAPPPKPERAKSSGSGVSIVSPMVGTFYRSASPDSPNYVNEGDVVKKGQTLCIIEAMKLMNEIEAEVEGRVTHILKENASPVEFGEELFVIEPV